MQVSHVKDHVTHAIIGGEDSIEFGISTSAEFFNILSSTLYKDQILAVVREVLCNAWDAHIEAGCTHLPVEITLTEDKFTIKDSGHGIHRNDMGVIYGTYGNSTKKNDGQQTGGFGLGCKAPFSYTDHFEVISNNEGVKTIYNLSKSSAQAMGKPGIVPIASFPTKDTGLQVSININTKDDYHRFNTLIRRIAKNGDMNIMMNGELLDKLNFDTSVNNYYITTDYSILDAPTSIMVRYGNVVYPVDSEASLHQDFQRIERHLDALKINRHAYRIIFQAPPHSISVTPSRESLSMQEHTVKTLKALMTGFLNTLDTNFLVTCNEFAQAAVENAITDVRVGDLLSTTESLPLRNDKTAPAKITDLLTMAQRYMESNYPKSLDFRKKDIEFRLKSMVKGGLLDRGIVQTYLREIPKVTISVSGYGREYNQWLQRQVLGPLSAKLMKAGMDHKRLYVYDPEDRNTPYSRYSNALPIVEAINSRPKHLFNTLPYLRNIVVLATARSSMNERAMKHEVFKKLGKYPGYLFYQVGMKKADRENALAFFAKTGMHVVDLTVKQEWELTTIAKGHVYIAPPRKPAKKGLLALNSILSKHMNIGINTHISKNDIGTRILKPEFVIAISTRKDVPKSSIDSWDSLSSQYIVELFGDKGGITANSATHAKYIESGAKEFTPYITEKLAEIMTTNVNIQEYWAFHPNRIVDNVRSYNNMELFNLIYKHQILRSEFGIINNLTVDEQKYIHLWNELSTNTRRHAHNDLINKTIIHLKGIPVNPLNTSLVRKFNSNPLLALIKPEGLISILKEQKPGSVQMDNAIKILTLAINN